MAGKREPWPRRDRLVKAGPRAKGRVEGLPRLLAHDPTPGPWPLALGPL